MTGFIGLILIVICVVWYVVSFAIALSTCIILVPWCLVTNNKNGILFTKMLLALALMAPARFAEKYGILDLDVESKWNESVDILKELLREGL